MEQAPKEKKTRECGFINILDPSVKSLLIELVSPPYDATNFIFWYSKVVPNEWGLTIKSIPSKDSKQAFTSQHTWKMTWFNDNGALKIANHCKSLGNDVSGAQYDRIVELYNNYKK